VRIALVMGELARARGEWGLIPLCVLPEAAGGCGHGGRALWDELSAYPC
jgi:hypothetical protein